MIYQKGAVFGDCSVVSADCYRIFPQREINEKCKDSKGAKQYELQKSRDGKFPFKDQFSFHLMKPPGYGSTIVFIDFEF
jgi:hypothetical protein